MASRFSTADFLFDVDPALKRTFGNRRNWLRFCALADTLAAELALRRWV